MMYKENVLGKFVLGGVSLGLGSVMSWLLGDIDDLLYILLTLMAVDMVAGFAMAYRRSEVSSKRFGEGIKRKLMSLVLIALGVSLDRILDHGWAIRTLTMWSLIAYEGLSILEHCVDAGIPVPSRIAKVLIQIRADVKPMTSEELEKLKENIRQGENVRKSQVDDLYKDIDTATCKEKLREERERVEKD